MAPKIITVDLSGPLCDVIFEGEDAGALKPINEVKDAKGRYRDSLAKTFASIIRSSSEGDAVKYLDDSIDLLQTGKLKVVQSDYEAYLNLAKSSKSTWVVFRAQIIRAFEAGKKASDQEEKVKEGSSEK